MSNALKLVVSIIITLGIGLSASFFTRPEIDGWFQTIQKPSWNPPNAVFAPVWTTLYILMGIALYLVWKRTVRAEIKRPAIILFSVQMILNFCWSLIFFNQHLIGLALVDIICLWVAIVLTIFAFARINRLAAWLLVPYICWVSFAGLLNFAIWRLNG